MKKSIIIVFCIFCVIGSLGCGKRTVQNQQMIANSKEEEVALEEENLAYENRPKFQFSVNEMSDILEKDTDLKKIDDKNLCIFEEKRGKFEIQIGEWNQDISEIYYTLYKEKPFDDKELSSTFYETLERIFLALSVEFNQEKIEKEFTRVTKPEQTIEFEYSEDVKLFMGMLGEDFDFRIYPQKNN